MENLQIDNLEKVSGGYRGIDEDEFVQISATYLGKKEDAMKEMNEAINSFGGGGVFVIAMISCTGSEVKLMARLKNDKSSSSRLDYLLTEHLEAKKCWSGITIKLHDY